MKRRVFIAMFLIVGTMLGLSGCANSKSTLAPVETEEVSTSVAEEVAQEEPEDLGYTVDDLVNFWSSGSLTEEEIGTMVAAGVVSNEVYEEFLDYISDDEEFVAQLEETPEDGNSTINIDTLSLLTAHVIEFEDVDGYQIRETIQISPIFREGDLETARALWEALGNDVESFPSKKSICDQKRALSNYQLEYVVGTCMIENLTEGFSFTSDSPRSYGMSLTAKGHDGTDAFFTNSSVSAVAYSNGIKYYSDISSVKISDVKLTADAWGPCTFVIALPNAYTPNQPNGYRYDEIQLIFDYNIYEPGNDSRQNIFELKYFK